MIGIDIGSKSIKVVDVIKEGNTFKLKASGVVGYSGLTPDKMTEEKDFVALSEIIKKLVKQIGVSTRDANVAIAEDLAFTRVIKFPNLSEEEINSAVKWEAEQYIPIPINEAIVQHSVLFKDETSSSVSVLLIAAPRAVVEKYVKLLRLANLNPIAAETELMALSRALSSEKGVNMVIDLGAESTDIGIVRDGVLAFSRSIPVAGEALTRAVSQSLNIASSQAEEYKKTYGLKKDQLEGKIKNAVDPVFRIITEEIKKAIHFFQSEEKGDPPSSILISGGVSNMPELSSELTTALGIEVALADPFAKISLEPEMKKSLAPYSSLYGIAVGLALRDD